MPEPQPHIVCYVSGHGFGHAVRTMEVLRALWRVQPDVEVHIRTPLPRWIFDFTLDGPFTLTDCRLDVGAVQADSLSVDVEATLRAYAQIDAERQKQLDAEVEAIGSLRPALLLADIPALAFDIATRLGIPGIGMANFSWDWIYADYVRDFPQYADLVASLSASYRRCDLLLRLPMHGELSAFPRICDIPLVARRARLASDEVRRRLSLGDGKRLVLLSFGGLGADLQTAPQAPASVTFLSTQAAAERFAPLPSMRMLTNDELSRAAVRYEDLVGACDAVITKPGYGIVAECIANGTSMVYTSRGRFAEYPLLVQGICEHLANAFISNDDLYGGHWNAALEEVLSQERRAPAVDCSGATAAAEQLLRHLG